MLASSGHRGRPGAARPQDARGTVATNAAVDFVPEKARPLAACDWAGGGVGGLTTALTLFKAGHDVTIYEKTQAFARFGAPSSSPRTLSTLKAIDEKFLPGSWTPLPLRVRDGAVSRTV